MLDINSLLGWQPKTPQVSQVICTAANGYGSAGTAIRRFANVVQNIGESIVYRSDPVQGDFFQLTQSGIYYAYYSDQKTDGGVNIGITLDQPNLTVAIQSLTQPVVLSYLNIAAGLTAVTSSVFYAKAGSIVRANSGNAANATSAIDVSFRITLIAAT